MIALLANTVPETQAIFLRFLLLVVVILLCSLVGYLRVKTDSEFTIACLLVLALIALLVAAS